MPHGYLRLFVQRLVRRGLFCDGIKIQFYSKVQNYEDKKLYMTGMDIERRWMQIIMQQGTVILGSQGGVAPARGGASSTDWAPELESGQQTLEYTPNAATVVLWTDTMGGGCLLCRELRDTGNKDQREREYLRGWAVCRNV